MLRATVLSLAGAGTVLCSAASAQSFAPRSVDYLFAATADDARAIWVNPAGLAVLPQASIMGELVVHRPANSDLRLSQLTFGFNSQGLAFGYNRERLPSETSNHTYRLALARTLLNWTFGFSVSYFHSDINDNGFDVGVRYRLMRSVYSSIVVRNIGQPQVRADTLPLTGVAGIGWMVIPGALLLNGEAVGRNRIDASGIDMSYRAGARISLGPNVPITGIASVHFGERLAVRLWTFGLSVGGYRRGIFVADVTPPNGATSRLETLSIAGVATNDLATMRR